MPALPPSSSPHESWSQAFADDARMVFPLFLLLVAFGFLAGLKLSERYLPAEPQGNRLAVASQPSGASVFLNGRLAGATPILITGLEFGRYVLRLEKDGHKTETRRLELSRARHDLDIALKTVPTGRMVVKVVPAGAEVLLDGVLIGLTPLAPTMVSAGSHDLMIRKTNFEPFVKRIEVIPGDSLVFKTELRDKILAMLKRQVSAEPQRVSHYLGLGHYLFVNDHLDEAARIYTEAITVAATPLKFPEGTPDQEKEIENRLRSQDVRRLHDDLRKKKHWPGKNVAAFRAKVEKAQNEVAREHVESWVWVKGAARNLIMENKLDRAEKIYQRHIKAAPDSRHLPQAFIELLRVRLKMHNLSGVKETFNLFMERYGKRADLLRQAANAVYSSHSVFRHQERLEILGIAEKMLRTALKVTDSRALRALCTYELAIVTSLQGRHADALKLYDQSLAETTEPNTKELRLIKKAECLIKLRRIDDARKIYKEMTKSPRSTARRLAEQGLQVLKRHKP